MENGWGASLGASVRSLNVFDGLALLIALGLVGAGFLIGSIGGGESGSTTPVELTVIPDDQARPLQPGATTKYPVYVNNPNDYGVRVDLISEGSSNATAGGCPAGTVTSIGIESPAGFISPKSIRAYEVSVTMAATPDGRCQAQSFTLPLSVTLVSADGDRTR